MAREHPAGTVPGRSSARLATMDAHRRLRLAGPTAALILTLVACEPRVGHEASPALAGTLRLSGSTTVYPLARAAADAFTRLHPAVRFDLSQNSTGEGLQAFIRGAVDIAGATRAPTADELAAAHREGRRPHLTVIAYDAVVVLANASNPAENVSIRELRDIFFTGRVSDWSQLPGASAVSRPIHVFHTSPAASGTAEHFQRKVATARPTSYVSGSRELRRTPEMASRVMEDADAIAYSPMTWAEPGVKMLSVDGVAAGERTCLDGTYPFCRKLLFITDGPPRGLAREFISFLLGTTCQQTVVRSQGFIPIF